MTDANWITLSLIIIAAGLLLFAYLKKFIMLQKVSSCFIIPLFAILNILVLRKYLPDSLHLIKVTIMALSLVTISTVFIAFEKLRTLRIAGRVLVVSSLLCWISLYHTIFYIHKVSIWLIILMCVLYLAGIVVSIILAGKQEIKFSLLFALSFALSAYLHFCSLIFLCFETSGSSVMLFAGTSVFTALTAFHFINQARLKFKHAGVIRYCLLIASQILIACSNILMIR